MSTPKRSRTLSGALAHERAGYSVRVPEKAGPDRHIDGSEITKEERAKYAVQLPLRNVDPLSWEEFAPRDESNRFRIYCRDNEGALTLVATCATAEAVGVAIVTLGAEGEFDDCACGVLDTMGETGRKWVLRPWEKSAANLSAAGKVLRSAQNPRP